MPFNPSEHDYAKGKGDSVISGRAFMRSSYGGVVYASGSTVYLLPDTSYTREIYNKGSRAYGPVNISNGDGRLLQYFRTTLADGAGRFTFSGIPAGSYLIVTEILWMADGRRQGGDVMKFVSVSAGQKVDVVLSR
ncbi:hypothetical protein OSH11_08130 [Kaistia dalseonensis]|uniref:Carboxypeptidase regulatory-like domain-containing protein n=1 Tax=Kaistia dalseonensis TaxID=410840 RepID=A0ABU0H5V0_9HYPH|nr:hypothetical protein [Kaistia dalseonensis]MCX5494667.1 hypothetical protein [Kaistia dalseonensis]MDQ0437248.1 hypothetical protein [Kaistia dalseonensis]